MTHGPYRTAAVLASAEAAGVPAIRIGATGGPAIRIAVNGAVAIDVPVDEAETRWKGTLRAWLDGRAA